MQVEQEFKEHIQGLNELYWWKCDLEHDFENGRKINKTKYNKICNLYEKRRQKAEELLDKVNRCNPYVHTCMPPPSLRPPV